MFLDAMMGAVQNFASAQLWLFMALGMVIGLLFGVIPGISGMLAVSLILPFVFTMRAEQALPLMLSVVAVQPMGGSITAILMNVPGTPQSAATLLDGYPMTQKGRAGLALGAAEASSGLANVLTSFLALAIIPLILPIVMVIRSADMVFIILLGITFIAMIASGSMIKGLISGGLGLLVAFIGFHITTGVGRFTFGSLYLYDGIPLVPLILGLFAVPEMVALATRGGTIARTRVVITGMQDVWEGVRSVWEHKSLVLRCQIIGFIAGAVPGVGASPATFMAYGHAKQTSKHPEEFGTGTIEGIIAPESANNACEAGALLTTLALGVPGSGIMAILLGAFMMLGIIPGPEMLTKHLDLSLTLIWVIAITGIIAASICIFISPYLTRIAFVPAQVLVPLVLVIALVGAFSYHERLEDMVVTFLFGCVGLVMRNFEYNRPALLLGFILGRLFEQYLFIALKIDGPLFFVRPISLALIIVIVGVFVYKPIISLIRRRRGVGKR